MEISCNSVEISSKSQVKYLGVTIDNDMSGSTMGNSVVKKINSRIEFLYRKGVFRGFNETKMYSALIQSSFDYASNSWFRGFQKKNLTLQVC